MSSQILERKAADDQAEQNDITKYFKNLKEKCFLGHVTFLSPSNSKYLQPNSKILPW